MAESQAELRLTQPETGESEQDSEARLHAQLLRHMEDAADEIGRAHISYALHITEGLLSKKLRGVEEKVADARILAFELKHQKSGRLARWLAEYTGHLPFERPAEISAVEAVREIVAMAVAGEMGRAAAEKVLSVYARVEKRRAAK